MTTVDCFDNIIMMTGVCVDKISMIMCECVENVFMMTSGSVASHIDKVEHFYRPFDVHNNVQGDSVRNHTRMNYSGVQADN